MDHHDPAAHRATGHHHDPRHEPDHGHHPHGSGHDHEESYGEALDAESAVLAGLHADIVSRLPVSDPELIVDLGCGTGAGTFALLDRFADARVIAVDATDDHLRRLRDLAAERGVADRVDARSVDLDGHWPDLGRPDLVWASASMHHLADPEQVARRVAGTLAPGGILAVVETPRWVRFLPDDAPAEAPGLEDRLDAVFRTRHAEQLPHLDADWATLLSRSGFAVEPVQTVTAVIPGDHPRVPDHARHVMQRSRDRLADALSAADRAALDRLLDDDGPDAIVRRPDLAARAERVLWVARPLG